MQENSCGCLLLVALAVCLWITVGKSFFFDAGSESLSRSSETFSTLANRNGATVKARYATPDSLIQTIPSFREKSMSESKLKSFYSKRFDELESYYSVKLSIEKSFFLDHFVKANSFSELKPRYSTKRFDEFESLYFSTLMFEKSFYLDQFDKANSFYELKPFYSTNLFAKLEKLNFTTVLAEEKINGHDKLKEKMHLWKRACESEMQTSVESYDRARFDSAYTISPLPIESKSEYFDRLIVQWWASFSGRDKTASREMEKPIYFWRCCERSMKSGLPVVVVEYESKFVVVRNGKFEEIQK